MMDLTMGKALGGASVAVGTVLANTSSTYAARIPPPGTAMQGRLTCGVSKKGGRRGRGECYVVSRGDREGHFRKRVMSGRIAGFESEKGSMEQGGYTSHGALGI